MIKKAIKNSFTFALMLVQLIRIHKKINKVVRRTKKSEIPSIPRLKFKFKSGIHKNLVTNWKEPVDLLKNTHKNNEIIYIKLDTFKAKNFKSEWLDAGTNNKKKVPTKGSIKMKTNKFAIFNKEKSNINIL